MARFAVVRPDTVVENVIEWDGITPYSVVGRMLIEADDNAEPGGTWDGIRFQRPTPKIGPQPTLDEKLKQLGLTRAELRAAVAGPP
jgi:hypothetical protein